MHFAAAVAVYEDMADFDHLHSIQCLLTEQF